MGSNEYWAGRDLEKNDVLKEYVAKIFNFERVETDGSTRTKGDLIGINGSTQTRVSVKYASGKNTQVHLPTLRSLASQLNMPPAIYNKLDRFLGTNDNAQWAEWAAGLNLSTTELKYKRLHCSNIPSWDEVPLWFNANNRKIAILLLQSLKDEDKASWLIWANKKKGGFCAVDVNRLVDWIVETCVWVTMPKGTVLRCAIPSEQAGEIGKPIFFMQMKNSGGPAGDYNHCPQFHLHNNWPEKFVVHRDTDIQFN